MLLLMASKIDASVGPCDVSFRDVRDRDFDQLKVVQTHWIMDGMMDGMMALMTCAPVQALHNALFPIDYEDSFFLKVIRKEDR